MDAATRRSDELIQQLKLALSVLPAGSGWLVAFSGGRDSTVLLHALGSLAAAAGQPLRAVHVNHGLQAPAAAWVAHCRRFCETHGLALQCLEVDARAPRGHSPEAWARQRRYRAFAQALKPGEVLMTAHHQQDQGETVLLQLLRGAGPNGLAAMPACGPFSSGWHARPMLACRREQIDAYASRHGLEWCEDPSNAQACYDRNYLRQDILPRLGARWPAWPATLARAAAWQADAAAILAQVAAADLAVAAEDDCRRLVIARLLEFESARRRNLLRHWLQRLGLPPPHAVQLEEILKAVVVREDAAVCVHWNGGELRRHRGRLHAMRPLPHGNPALRFSWADLGAPLALPLGRLEASSVPGQGISARRLRGGRLTVRFRQGGERCRPRGRAHSQTLKRLMQEDAIPPWLRPHMPLLYLDDELVAVGDRWVCEPFQAAGGESGWVLRWRIEGRERSPP